MQKRILLTIIFLFLSQLIVTGCSSVTPTPTPPITPTAGGDGKALYDSKCAGCHGVAGTGGQGGALNTGVWKDVSKVVGIIKKGKGSMPAYEGKLKDEEINAIGNYVASLKK